ncbi:MAG: hypothetical protein JXA69_08800 [Phycisphaerae bacterium]|nr:hypothetical protein [Phycisphaerae bacterium]
MSKRGLLCAGCVLALLLASSHLLLGAAGSEDAAPIHQRLVIKICNWDGVVPEKALDGFTMPKGTWADYQRQGWTVESYIVAPNGGNAKSNGFYAVLRK